MHFPANYCEFQPSTPDPYRPRERLGTGRCRPLSSVRYRAVGAPWSTLDRLSNRPALGDWLRGRIDGDRCRGAAAVIPCSSSAAAERTLARRCGVGAADGKSRE